MRIAERIEHKLRDGLSPQHLEVINESGMHAVAPGSETHFRVLVVTARFEGHSLVQRHRMIYELLADERRDGVHALGIQTLTPQEHAALTAPATSPPCLGGDGQR